MKWDENGTSDAPHRHQRDTKTKFDVFTHYGGSPPVCAICGFSDFRALCLDHINGEGQNDHKSFPGWALYRHLKFVNFPPGYQVLCANCNQIKGA